MFVEPAPLPSSPMLLPASSMSVQPEPAEVCRSFAQFSQAVVRVGDADWVASFTHPATLSPSSLPAMQRLVESVKVLRSPDSGWHSHRPLTPELLTPYLTEEATDVLETLQTDPPTGATWRSRNQPAAGTGNATYLIVEALIPHLLWGIARSSWLGMQWIAGRQIHCVNASGTTTSGMIRLVPLLTVQTEMASQQFDLTTGRYPDRLLPLDVRLQLDRSLGSDSMTCLENQPICSVGTLIERSQTVVQTVTPGLVPWFAGIAIALLYPDEDWQQGQFHLHLGLEFIPNPDPAVTPPPQPDDLAGTVEQPGIDPKIGVAAPLIQVCDRPFLEQSNQVQQQRRIRQGLMQIALAQAADPLSALVQLACHLADHPPMDWEQPQRLLDELLPRLLWELTHASYPVMQLLGGVPAKLLAPGKDWQFGTLRLLAALTIQSQDWQECLDLTTGGRVEPGRSPSPQAIAVLPTSDDPMLLEPLLARLLSPLKSELFEFWMAGIQVRWLSQDRDWQPATLKLGFSLEWIDL